MNTMRKHYPIFTFGLFVLTVLVSMQACKSSSSIYKAPKVAAFRAGEMPAPPGMVYVPSGRTSQNNRKQRRQ